MDEETIALLARDFKKMLRNKRWQRQPRKLFHKRDKHEKKGKPFNSNKMVSTKHSGCFECGSQEHMIKDCPKRSTIKKKAMIATWSDSEPDSDGNESDTSKCLMAISDSEYESDVEESEVDEEHVQEVIKYLNKYSKEQLVRYAYAINVKHESEEKKLRKRIDFYKQKCLSE